MYKYERIQRTQERLEFHWTEHFREDVIDEYQIDRIEQLTEEQIRDIFAYSEEIREEYPLFSICLKNLCTEWDMTHGGMTIF